MTFEIQIYDDFDFNDNRVRCSASRSVSIKSDTEISPELLATALQGVNFGLPSVVTVDEMDFLDEEEKIKAEKNKDLIERIVRISSSLLNAVPSIISTVYGGGSMGLVETFPPQAWHTYWVNSTATTLPTVDINEGDGTYTPRYLFVSRDSEHVWVTLIFDLGVADNAEGGIINQAEIKASENRATVSLTAEKGI